MTKGPSLLLLSASLTLQEALQGTQNPELQKILESANAYLTKPFNQPLQAEVKASHDYLNSKNRKTIKN